jgi:GlcNAc-P-P-Und epimerase
MKILVTGGSGFIGTNFIEEISPTAEVLNYSHDAPLCSDQTKYWRRGDILDRNSVETAFQQFRPDWVLHLAARAECDEKTTLEKGYRVNTEGTGNVLNAIANAPSIQRVIITSSQFVCAPGRLPRSDTDYFPETVYGESKVITEKLTREANLPCCWTIVRPTNIWGPWHMRYRREFWRIVARGLYLHPGNQPVVRCYGYVKNVVYQIRRIFESEVNVVSGKTFYLGDRPINLYDWANGFSRVLTGHRVRVVPRALMRCLAALGDIPTRLTGKAFALNSSRLRSMTTDYLTPMDKTFGVLGENPYTLEQGILQTVEWLRSYEGADALGGGF